jgi:hypothetical protein
MDHTMASKKYEFKIREHTVTVEAEEEGACRYMVRMMCPDVFYRVRIGYLTGSGRTWVTETIGGIECATFRNAKDACNYLANVNFPKIYGQLKARPFSDIAEAAH